MDDAQRRTTANELQKPNYDYLICYLFGNDFLAAKYYQIRDRSFIIQKIYRIERDFPSVYSSLLSN